ncbi:MAG: hypothetical protein QM785_09030 [Pyrinomonadaceae bacterium]
MLSTKPAKPYRLTFEERPSYLYAYVEGEKDNYDISRAYWQEVADMVVRIGSECVLIDENIVESGSFADVYRLASEIPEMGFGRARIAFVDRFLDQSEVNEFGELVALNRGANGRVFNDVKTAESWLLTA